jgi:hypothetical protein
MKKLKVRKCNCPASRLKNTGWRESTCSVCGTVWIWYKHLDASGNWDFDKERKQ